MLSCNWLHSSSSSPWFVLPLPTLQFFPSLLGSNICRTVMINPQIELLLWSNALANIKVVVGFSNDLTNIKGSCRFLKWFHSNCIVQLLSTQKVNDRHVYSEETFRASLFCSYILGMLMSLEGGILWNSICTYEIVKADMPFEAILKSAVSETLQQDGGFF